VPYGRDPIEISSCGETMLVESLLVETTVLALLNALDSDSFTVGRVVDDATGKIIKIVDG
jgi:hypothetical protein